MIKLVILDFDDTLINNESLDYESFKNTSIFFKSYRPTKTEIRKFRKMGFVASEIIKIIQKKSKQKFNEHEFINYRKDFLESTDSIQYLKFQPYAKLFFKKLYSYNIPIVICSLRKHKSIIKNFFNANNTYLYINFIMNDEKGNLDTRNAKNSLMVKIKMIEKILKKYRLKSSEVLSLGNSISDYRSAKKCEIKHYTIFFNHNYLPKPKSKFILSFNEFFQVLIKINKNMLRKNKSFKY